MLDILLAFHGKFCTGCLKWFSFDDYYQDLRNENGKYARCKYCCALYRKKIIRAKLKKKQVKSRITVESKLAANLRSRIWFIVRHGKKQGSAVRDLGCTLTELKNHLESRFQPGMAWNNYGQWHIDHIKPLASFNLLKREQFLQAVHYTNLQPLWAKDNWEKKKIRYNGIT